MRILSKPSTAKCNIDTYTSYLLSEPMYTSCTRLSDIMQTISHDSINRFLNRERFEAKDLFDEVCISIELKGGTLSIDDSVLDKPYANQRHNHLVSYFWSGKHKRTVKGINLITLYYTDDKGVKVPVNFRLYDPEHQKTKNDYFQEMVLEVLQWGLIPEWVSGDSWYSSLENLKFLRKQGLNSMFAVEKNRIISLEKGTYQQIQSIEQWPSTGLKLYLKGYGMVKAFRQEYKKDYRYYVMSTSDLDKLDGLTESDFKRVHANHWSIECYHRTLKQACNLEKFQVRNKHAVLNHVFCSIRAFVQLELMRVKEIIINHYQIRSELFRGVIAEFIRQRLAKTPYTVNA